MTVIGLDRKLLFETSVECMEEVVSSIQRERDEEVSRLEVVADFLKATVGFPRSTVGCDSE